MSRQSTALAEAEVDRTTKAYETFQARLAQAYASRSSQRAGQRFATLEAVREAAGLVRQWRMPAERLDELRNLAIAALTLPDVQTLRSWKKLAAYDSWDTDGQLKLVAGRSADGSVTVSRIDTEEVIARLHGVENMGLSPSGRFLLAIAGNRFRLWELSDTGPRAIREGEAHGYAFHPDGRHVLISGRDGSLWRYDMAMPTRQPSLLMRLQPDAQAWAFDPHGERLAVTRPKQVEIRDARTGRVLSALPVAGVGGTPAWHPGGKYLALIPTNGAPFGGRDIHLWDIDRRKRMAILRGCPSGGVQVTFTPDGDRLLGRGRDSILRLWDWRTGRQLLQHAGNSNLKVRPMAASWQTMGISGSCSRSPAARNTARSCSSRQRRSGTSIANPSFIRVADCWPSI